MTVTLRIEKTVYGGKGLARLGDGRVCFVNGAFAGETVKAELGAEHKRYVEARLTELLEPGEFRIDPGETIPGMVYAGVDYAAELRFKQDQLENFLWKACPEVLPLEVIGAPSRLNYRNKATYHLEPGEGGGWKIGYRTEPEHRVVDVERDPLARPEINNALGEIRGNVKTLLTQGAKSVRRSARNAGNVTVRWTPIDGVKWWLEEPPAGLELCEQTAGMKFKVSADGFFQVNPEVGELLVKAVAREYLEGAEEAGDILDLYCGVGVFALACKKALAGSGKRVEARICGIESGRAAIDCAKRNAAAAGMRGNFFCGQVGGSLHRVRIGENTTVIVDPPRGGMERNVPGWLARCRAKRILCVSCDPATMTRDLEVLLKAYRIKCVKLFDMFPRTARFETLVALERR